MSCKKYSETASAHLDRQLSESEAARYAAHLAGCAGCRQHLKETERVSIALRATSRPDLPRELHGYIMTAVERRVAGQVNSGQRMVEWMLRLNPKPLSYAASVLVSTVLFAITLSGFRPIPIEDSSGRSIDVVAVTEITPVMSPDSEYHIYNNLPLPRGQEATSHAYDLPRVLGNSALVSFSRMASPGPTGMSAMVEVAPDGTARLVRMLQSPEDSRLVDQLWWFLGKPNTFQPAMVDGKPATTNIIFLVEQMDISG